ncbi:MAG: sigma-70 family RNA polymerase sigma factor [Acidobacteriota bacterium]
MVACDAGELHDSELIARAQGGDGEAFARLYRRHQGVVYRFACQMTGSATLAEDVVQDVFLVLMHDLGRYDASRAALTTYLYGVARNISRYRIRGLRRLTSLDAVVNAVAVDDPSAHLAQSQQIRQLRGGIAVLPARYREVLLLCDVHELTYREAALALKLPVGTLRSRLHRARRLLAEKLQARQKVGARVPLQSSGCVV